ncbi:MAG: CMP deaminase [Hyphomicrobiaceae bacterium]|nr:MAG: CMP deaminase [Hyphomicrobiaceae bacterium]
MNKSTQQAQVDDFFLRKAYQYAREQSTDPSTQNFAIIVDPRDNCIISQGPNRFPKGVHESPMRWERPLKYSYVEHAARNAIYAAARQGISTFKTVMYCPWFACADCARGIIEAGISEVVGHAASIHKSRPDWQKSIDVALDMLCEAGVKLRYVDGHLGCSIRFDGNIVTV